MTQEDALQRQIELYRAMTGEQRLKIALDLHEFACDVAREGIRHQFPQADETEAPEALNEFRASDFHSAQRRVKRAARLFSQLHLNAGLAVLLA